MIGFSPSPARPGRIFFFAALCCLVFTSSGLSQEGTPVGISRVIDAIIPGGEIEPIPQEDRKSPVMLRMERVDPTETGFHYRIACIGLEPGTHDLRKYLRWKDRSNTAPLPDRPEWKFVVRSVLPPGMNPPAELKEGKSPILGGYRYWIAAGVLLWSLGLLAILLWPSKKPLLFGRASAGPTLVERLRPLVEKALRGQMSNADQAELERMLIGFWRKKLNWDNLDPAASLKQLKAHPEAGALLATLEDWLHRPPATRTEPDIEALLRPYKDLKAEDWERLNPPVSVSPGGARAPS